MNPAFQYMHAYLMLLLYPTFSQFPSPPKHKMKALPFQPNSFKINITNKTPCNLLYTRVPVGFCPVLYDLECIFSYFKLTYLTSCIYTWRQQAKFMVGKGVIQEDATLYLKKFEIFFHSLIVNTLINALFLSHFQLAVNVLSWNCLLREIVNFDYYFQNALTFLFG